MRHFQAGLAIVLALAAGPLAAQDAPSQDSTKMKKFLTKPLVIEDQGSFFIGGVPKVTNYASAPRAKQSHPGVGAEPDHHRTNVRAVRDPRN